MSEPLVPAAAQLAAKRAFVRTTAQGYATSITGSLVISVVSLIQNPGEWLIVVIAILTALLTPLAAGAAAYWSWLSKGIPDEYAVAAVDVPGVLEDPAILQRAWAANVARNQAVIDAEAAAE